MARVLRADPGSLGMVSGVGMTMTKHVFGVYSTTPGTATPPDAEGVQKALDATEPSAIADTFDGDATVAAYSVVHGRDGEPEWALLVCDVAADGSRRAYARGERTRIDGPRRIRGARGPTSSARFRRRGSDDGARSPQPRDALELTVIARRDSDRTPVGSSDELIGPGDARRHFPRSDPTDRPRSAAST